MSKASVGHSAHDVTAGLVEELTHLPDKDTQLAFLRAAIVHGEGQLEAAEQQVTSISDKRETVMDVWDAKLNEAEDIRDRAAETLAAINREHNALGG